MEVSHSGQLHTLGKREPHGFAGSNPVTSASWDYQIKKYVRVWIGVEIVEPRKRK